MDRMDIIQFCRIRHQELTDFMIDRIKQMSVSADSVQKTREEWEEELLLHQAKD